MVKHGVTIFFQGHDHLFARQERDGIVYQEVPMPADQGYVAYNEDRYRSGVKLPNSGHLRVTVSPEQVKVDYVRCYLAERRNRPARRPVKLPTAIPSNRKTTVPKIMLSCLSLLCTLSLLGPGVSASAAQPAAQRGHRARGPASSFNVAVPAHAYDLILARPESNSITLSILAYEDMEGFVAYGPQAGDYTVQMPVRQFKKGVPVELVIGGLQANNRYYYQFRWRAAGAEQFSNSPEYTFHTARPPGSTFTFTMTADSHLDEHTSPDVYGRTLTNIRADRPDFHIDLGNLFMTDKHASRDEAARQYLAQRYYLGQIGPSAPILLALSTHDGENSKYDDGSADCLAVWSCLMRKRYFPNPVPDDFYTGNIAPMPHCGLPQNYYAWQWGDALFVVLDPFRYSLRQRGSGDGWAWSLGLAQYRWLAQTLEQSRARFKFVFIHNLLCGDQAARAVLKWRPSTNGAEESRRQRRLQAAPARLGYAGSPIAGPQPRGGRLQGTRQFLCSAGTGWNRLSNDSSAEFCRQRPHP